MSWRGSLPFDRGGGQKQYAALVSRPRRRFRPLLGRRRRSHRTAQISHCEKV